MTNISTLGAEVTGLEQIRIVFDTFGTTAMAKKILPHNISTLKMGSLGESKTHLRNAASLLSRKYVNNGVKIFLKGTVGFCRSKGCKVAELEV